MNHERGQESPMDFQWENLSGHVDPKSPFSMTFPPRTPSSPSKNLAFPPPKQPDFTPSAPALTPRTPNIPKDFRTAPFTTPRKFDTPTQTDDSLLTDTSDTTFNDDSTITLSPMKLADDVLNSPTPAPAEIRQISSALRSVNRPAINRPYNLDYPLSSSVSRVTQRGEIMKPRSRRDPFVRTPGRGRLQDYSSGSTTDSDADEDLDTPPALRRRRERRRPSKPSKSSIFSGVSLGDTHHDRALSMSYYAQAAFNTLLFLLGAYMVYSFYGTIQVDVNKKVAHEAALVMQEAETCQKAYVANRCAPDVRVPAMEEMCSAWEICMKRQPESVGRAKASMEIFAGLLNAFFDTISYKTFGFMLALGCAAILVLNGLFGFWRAKHIGVQNPLMAAGSMSSPFPSHTPLQYQQWIPPPVTPGARQLQREERERVGWRGMMTPGAKQLQREDMEWRKNERDRGRGSPVKRVGWR